MPPLPKRKTSKSRQGERRAHLYLEAPNLTECPQCHTMILPHQVCIACGYYDGESILKVKGPKKKPDGGA